MDIYLGLNICKHIVSSQPETISISLYQVSRFNMVTTVAHMVTSPALSSQT